jgi:hypothetical protein
MLAFRIEQVAQLDVWRLSRTAFGESSFYRTFVTVSTLVQTLVMFVVLTFFNILVNSRAATNAPRKEKQQESKRIGRIKLHIDDHRRQSIVRLYQIISIRQYNSQYDVSTAEHKLSVNRLFSFCQLLFGHSLLRLEPIHLHFI